jgi:hypothetical protein
MPNKKDEKGEKIVAAGSLNARGQRRQGIAAGGGKSDGDIVAAGGGHLKAKSGVPLLNQDKKDKRQSDTDIIAAGGSNRSSAPSSEDAVPTGAGGAKKGGKR